ncbi:MAG: SufS family cysteine desulfurase [Gammaproteobacteria bacterium]|nr:SufS family cysteine desulfurase [Gammaproteobacteria bacterium]
MAAPLDIGGDFPILARQVNGQPLTYLDSAATTQKPQVVIDAVRHYYERRNANVHRAAHALAEEATAAMEDARAKVAALVGAGDARELIFTRGATEGINLVAAGLTDRLGPGDEVLITELEHHSNIVPWQMLCQRSGATLAACRVAATGEIDLADFHAKLGPRTKLVAIGHVSNALGTVNPVAELIDAAHGQGALALIDGAQAVQHLDVDVGRLDCDFYAFSAHKLFGPTGIGALYGRAALLEELPPYQGGGEMIEHVSIERTTYNQLPYKFEAGTPNIAGAVGFGAAADYLAGLPRQALRDREAALVSQAVSRLKQIPGVRMVGEPRERVSVVSFLVDGGHPHDFGTLLDQQGIAVRTGHHCAMPLMERLGVPGTIRASFALYNSPADVERLVAGVEKAIEFV